MQVLLAVYFFLAGVAVAGSRGRLLWLMPTAAVGCAVLLAVLALAFKALSPSFRCAHTVCARTCVGPQESELGTAAVLQQLRKCQTQDTCSTPSVSSCPLLQWAVQSCWPCWRSPSRRSPPASGVVPTVCALNVCARMSVHKLVSAHLSLAMA